MSFRFNSKIDDQFLFSLYEDDYAYMEEIFHTTQQQLATDTIKLSEAYAAGQVDDLKKAVHKIKPSFGFVGLLAAEAACQQFEDRCISVSSVKDLEAEYGSLLNVIEESRSIIDEEYIRLKQHNN